MFWVLTKFINRLELINCPLRYILGKDEPSNVNYNTSSFPSNTWLTDRAFMWVNIFWLVMPFYTILYYMIENCKLNKKKEIKSFSK